MRKISVVELTIETKPGEFVKRVVLDSMSCAELVGDIAPHHLRASDQRRLLVRGGSVLFSVEGNVPLREFSIRSNDVLLLESLACDAPNLSTSAQEV